MVIVYI